MAWTCAKDKIIAMGTDSVKWNLAHGPVGALIAQLSDFGWELPAVDSWRTFGGEEHILNNKVPIGPFVRWVGQEAAKIIWDRAAKHYCGRGLEGGPCPSSFTWLKNLRKEERHQEAGMLECILTGGFGSLVG